MIKVRVMACGRWSFRHRWAIGICIFSALVGFKVHGSSLGIWDSYVPDKTPAYKFFSIGENRRIRGDDFLVSIPAVSAQCVHSNFFPRINENYGGGGLDMFLSTPSCPVWDWTALGQPHNWGYFLFGLERGLAWCWFLRYIGLFLFSLEFFLAWTSWDKKLSLTAALAVCLGAPTQWWDTTIPYLLLYFFAGLVFVIKLFAERNSGMRWVWGGCLLVALSSFGFSFYPPFQLLFGYLWLLLAIHFVKRAQEPLSRRSWAVAWVVLGLWIAEWILFSHTHRDALETIRNSAYPGARFCSGGQFTFYLSYFFHKLICLFTAYRDVDFLNACEISMYAVPWAALLGLCVWGYWHGKNKVEGGFGLWVYGGALISWMLVTWPKPLAKHTGLFIVGPNRAAVAMSFVFLLLAFKSFSDGWRRGLRVPRIWAILIVIVSTGTQIAAFSAYPETLGYFLKSNSMIGLSMMGAGIGLFGVISWGLLRVNRTAFLGGYVACSLLTGVYVHPISIGASPILHKQLSERAKEIQRQYGEGLWVSNDSGKAQYLLANGMACINGVHHICNVKTWLTIDPGREYEHIWNRYAHIPVFIAPDNRSWAEITENREDIVSWHLCKSDLDRLGVRYLLWSGGEVREPWAILVKQVGADYIYRLVSTDVRSRDN